METIMKDYYKGFEGYPEIQFIRGLKDGGKEILSMWDGYFDSIMNAIEPKENCWTGIAYYYHIEQPWFEESEWKIPNVETVLNQFKEINITILEDKVQAVLNDIIVLLSNAQEWNETVWISYD